MTLATESKREWPDFPWASHRNEEKDGSRQWGQGGAPVNFLTDPINQTTSQLDLVLGYTGQKLQLTGGYYGTLFDNHNAFLSIPNSALFTQMALPPGSQSHQFHLAGGYNFSATTRGNFKAAYTRQTQTDQFFSSPPQLNTRTDLGGKVNTTLPSQVDLGFRSFFVLLSSRKRSASTIWIG